MVKRRIAIAIVSFAVLLAGVWTYGLFLTDIEPCGYGPIKGQQGIWYSEEFDECLKEKRQWN